MHLPEVVLPSLLKNIPYRLDKYELLNRTSSRIVRVAASRLSKIRSVHTYVMPGRFILVESVPTSFYVAYTKYTVDSFLAKPVNLPSKQVRPEIVTMFAIVFLAAVKVNDNSKASKKRIVDNLEYFH